MSRICMVRHACGSRAAAGIRWLRRLLARRLAKLLKLPGRRRTSRPESLPRSSGGGLRLAICNQRYPFWTGPGPSARISATAKVLQTRSIRVERRSASAPAADTATVRGYDHGMQSIEGTKRRSGEGHGPAAALRSGMSRSLCLRCVRALSLGVLLSTLWACEGWGSKPFGPEPAPPPKAPDDADVLRRGTVGAETLVSNRESQPLRGFGLSWL